MEAAMLKQLLYHLCANSQWSYAVFWKLHQFDNLNLFAYEDGYCDFQKVPQPCQCRLINCCSRQRVVRTSGVEVDHCDVHSLTCSLSYAVDAMSFCQFLLGEGMVGRVALDENDFWIYSDNIVFTELISTFGHSDEWLLPIAAGINTTFMVPVLPYGILQLGSFEKVAESAATGFDIKDMFFSLTTGATISPLCIYDDSHLNVMPEQEYNDESYFSYSDQPRMEDNDLSSGYQVEEFSCFITDQDTPYTYDLETNVEANEFVTASHTPEGAEVDGVCTHFVPKNVMYSPVAEVAYPDLRNIKGFTNDDYELQEALVPALKTNDDDCHSWNPIHEFIFDNQGFGDDVDVDVDVDVEPGDIKHFNEISHHFNLNKSTMHFQMFDKEAPCSDEENTSLIVSKHHNVHCTFAKSLTSPPSLESLESAFVIDQQLLDCSLELLDNDCKRPKHNRDCDKPKSSCKPRPRDRQLIQDRLKELRTLVPNSAKSSIDGLLDKTTTHINFLKKVSAHADKLKEFKEIEDASFQNEKTLEGGNKFEVCPIIVKDMEHSNQFLIQMVCNDEGVFFEMAEVIHKLKLTILKGLMEDRYKKWACFIVEASKGFNRLDIFWPLMRILQQNGNWMTDQMCIDK